MEIKVLGGGCANCKKLLNFCELAIKELDIKANLLYITDMIEITNSGLLRTPGLIINGEIVSQGRVPSLKEVTKLISNKL